MKRILSTITFSFLFSISAFAQTEILTNSDILEMTEAGLNAELIKDKVRSTSNNFDVSAKALIALKKGSVADEVIALMVEKSKTQPQKPAESKTENALQTVEKKNLTASDILRSARTIAIHKDSLNPNKQALEKELLKRAEWTKINLSIVESHSDSDLSVQISFVHFSLITHRYVWRVFDKRSGTVIAAGETTSWGSLAKNLARDIAKSLDKLVVN
ncbi:MAG TPA: hypothetical protein PKY59_27200 [Pyrinomonadaceae bacterium]|nr:hypothetical protein [Pyrinomonadaceae bacterium]